MRIPQARSQDDLPAVRRAAGLRDGAGGAERGRGRRSPGEGLHGRAPGPIAGPPRPFRWPPAPYCGDASRQDLLALGEEGLEEALGDPRDGLGEALDDVGLDEGTDWAALACDAREKFGRSGSCLLA